MGEMADDLLEEAKNQWLKESFGGSEADYESYLYMETEREREKHEEAIKKALSGVLKSLDNGTYWIGAKGKKTTLKNIKRRHAENIVRWLEARALLLHEYAVLLMLGFPEPGGEQAGYEFNEAFDRLNEMDPKEWLNEKPLMVNLRDRAKRNLIKGPAASAAVR